MSDNRQIVRVRVAKTNQDPFMLLDQARRLVDHQGRHGITAKSGQTNAAYQAKGYLQFVFPDEARAVQYQTAVDEYCPAAVIAERFRYPTRKV